MTAEVVIMNRSAVVMAADSAVSIVGPGMVKVYNRARKLMKANAAGTIGVMFYESPDFLGLPWESIVGEFVKDDTTDFDTVEACGDAFLSYLRERCREWSTAEETHDATSILLQPLVRHLAAQWSRITADPTWTATTDAVAQRRQVRTMVREVIRDRRPKLKDLTRADDIGPNADRALKTTIREILTDELSAFWPKLTDGLRGDLVALGCEEIKRIKRSEPGMTGLFFGGFGRSQLFPSAVHYLLAGRIEDDLRKTKRESYELGPKTPMVIAPLAQTDLIQTFMDGIDPKVAQVVHGLIDRLTAIAPAETPAEMASELKSVLDEVVHDHRRPVLDAVPFLPPNDLALMARSLLEFTALRQRVSMRPETVGGPFDVAVISRHSGFRWYEQSGVADDVTPGRKV